MSSVLIFFCYFAFHLFIQATFSLVHSSPSFEAWNSTLHHKQYRVARHVPKHRSETAPYQVLIKYTGKDGKRKSCGGVIVHEQGVITAAHCVVNKSPDDLTVSVGGNQIQVLKIDVHGGYEAGRASPLHDIAYLHMRRMNFDQSVQKISISANPDDEPEGTMGILYSGNVTGPSYLKFMPTCTCLKEHGPTKIKRTVFCTKRQNVDPSTKNRGQNGIGPCPGDSGSPLVVTKGSKIRIQERKVLKNRSVKDLELVGLVSFGDPKKDLDCKVLEKPAVYTKVSKYLTWINEMMIRGREGPRPSSRRPLKERLPQCLFS